MSDTDEVQTHWMTLGEMQKQLTLALAKGVYDPNAIFVVSKDPEGNGFVAFETFLESTPEQDMFMGAPAWIDENQQRWAAKLTDVETELPCVVFMSIHEIDPEF